jgi:hypothetical protein
MSLLSVAITLRVMSPLSVAITLRVMSPSSGSHHAERDGYRK